MPNLIMKCPNCGADMRLIDNQFECPYCHTISFSITDSKIDGDVTVMDPDEFARKLEESKRQFVVNIRDDLQVLDVETAVVNKKIADAALLLRHRDFLGALRALPSTEKPVLSAERIAFLATFKVVNEAELMLCSEPVEKNSHFQKILQLADEKTRRYRRKFRLRCGNILVGRMGMAGRKTRRPVKYTTGGTRMYARPACILPKIPAFYAPLMRATSVLSRFPSLSSRIGCACSSKR